MIVLICGGRTFGRDVQGKSREQANAELEQMWQTLDNLHQQFNFSLVIEGGANGADLFAKEWAHGRGLHVAQVDALWDLLHKAAGPVRNTAMLLLKPDMVIAFPGGTGTANMVEQAHRAGVKVCIVQTGPTKPIVVMGEAID